MKHLPLLIFLILVFAFHSRMSGVGEFTGKNMIPRYNRLTNSVTSYPAATIHDIQFVSPESLHVADSLGGTYVGPRWTCQASPLRGDTVVVTALVVVPSAANPPHAGITYQQHGWTMLLHDTAANTNRWGGALVRVGADGAVPDTAQARLDGFNNATRGDVITMTVRIEEFPTDGSINTTTQLRPVPGIPIDILSSSHAIPAPRLLTVDSFYVGGYPGGAVNFHIGEAYEGSLVRLVHLTVLDYVNTTRGTWSMKDASGNYLAELDASHYFTFGNETPTIPGDTSFHLPPLGAGVDTISGTILTNSGGENPRGYRICPLFPGDLLVHNGGLVGGAISGFVFNDLNKNNQRDTGESGIQNWQVFISGGNSDSASTVTDINGDFKFSGLDSGTYVINEEQRTGYLQTYPASGSYSVTVGAVDTVGGRNFGNFHSCSISGNVYNDLNSNGIKDGNEPELPGWLVRLSGARNDSTVTDPNGAYSFTIWNLGTYIVRTERKKDWIETFPPGLGDDTVTIAFGGQSFADLNFGVVFNPPKIKLSLTVHDASNAGSRIIFWGARAGSAYGIWGIDPQATDVDSSEGEAELPPAAGEVLDARFGNPLGTSLLFGGGSATDMRSFLSVAQTDTFRVNFQPGPQGYPITLKWKRTSIAESYSGSVILKDTSGSTMDMKTNDSIVVEDAGINHLLLVASYPQLPIVYRSGWNIVSLPVIAIDPRRQVLFPASTIAYLFDPLNGYTRTDTITPGRGYWLKFRGVISSLSFLGADVTRDTLDVSTGWNLIGTLGSPITVNTIETQPPGIRTGSFFGYDRGYHVADTLEANYGYWVKTNGNGKLIMSASASGNFSKNPMTTNVDAARDYCRLIFRDALDNEQTLFFTDRIADAAEDRLELPPPTPEGVLDVRFTNGSMLAAGRDGKTEEVPVQISSAGYPITVSWKLKSQFPMAKLQIGNRNILLNSNGSTQIPSGLVSVVLKLSSASNLPYVYTLDQNYPNPFNPVTTVKFSLPIESKVRLAIYDVLGQDVARLVDEVEQAGYKSVEWNADGVASGIYFYRLDATSTADPAKTFTQVRRMVLIK